VVSRMFDIGLLLGVGENTLTGSGGGVDMRRIRVGGRSLFGVGASAAGGSEGVLFFLGALLCVPKGGNSSSKLLRDSSAMHY
jgi:hypothetical protein